jgi:hypothetical protein
MMKSIFKFSYCLLACSLLYACSGVSNNEAALKEEIAGLKEQIKHLEATQSEQKAATGKIVHTVMFSLKHSVDAPETMNFLQDGQRILTTIPVVENFQVLRQVSPKNEFNFFFSMEFADQDAYRSYNDHPEHVKFVKERWETEVIKFLEADFVTLVE